MSNRLQRHGVRNLGCTSEKNLGKPSCDIEKDTRDCPGNMT
jgi:hypothetical protein